MWVPDKLPPEELYRFQGIQKRTGMSITHLEIHHATENAVPRMDGKDLPPCPHAFFYFRGRECVPEPDALRGLSDAERKEHKEAFFEQLPDRAARHP
jgi:hypothetical protein